MKTINPIQMEIAVDFEVIFMKNHLCKIISILLIGTLTMTLFTSTCQPYRIEKLQAVSKPTSGKWKENVFWKYDKKTKVLTITGTGLMQDAGDDTGDNPKWKWWQDDVKKIVIKGTLRDIGQSAFSAFRKLESVEMCDSITTIGACSFALCEKLKYVKLPKNLKKIEEGAFDLTALEKITLPNKLRYIGNNAFSGTALKKVEIPNSVTALKMQAFSYCENLKNVTLSKKLTKLEDRVFEGTDIRKIVIPSKIQEIGNEAFFYCENLKLVEIQSKKIKEIGRNAFLKISDIAKFKVLSSKKELYKNLLIKSGVDDSVRVNGKSISSKVNNDNAQLQWKFNENENTLIISGTGEMRDYEIAETKQDWYKKEEVVFVEKIVIEEGVTSIGRNAFHTFRSLTSLTLPSTLTSIGDNAFFNCESLKEIEIPESVNYIGEGAFAYTGLKQITIPSKTTLISKYCFAGCKKLKQISLPETIEVIQWGAFWRCKKLKDITFPASIKEIADYSFFESGIKNLQVRESVTCGEHILK